MSLLFGIALPLVRYPLDLPGLVTSQGTGGLLGPPLGFVHCPFDLISATAFFALVFDTTGRFSNAFAVLFYHNYPRSRARVGRERE